MKTLIRYSFLWIAFSTVMACGCYKVEPMHGIRGQGPMVEETFNTGSFTGIQVDVDANVNISQSGETSLTIKGQQNILDVLEVRVVNNVLVIQYRTSVWRHERMQINLSVAIIDQISSFGSARIYSESAFNTNDLGINIFGSGNVDFADINASSVRARINGSGTVSMKGSVGRHDVGISGSGDYNAGDVVAESAVISIFGSGNCRISVINSLEVAIHGSGNVYYRGNPPHKQASVFGSGKIIQLK